MFDQNWLRRYYHERGAFQGGCASEHHVLRPNLAEHRAMHVSDPALDVRLTRPDATPHTHNQDPDACLLDSRGSLHDSAASCPMGVAPWHQPTPVRSRSMEMGYPLSPRSSHPAYQVQFPSAPLNSAPSAMSSYATSHPMRRTGGATSPLESQAYHGACSPPFRGTSWTVPEIPVDMDYGGQAIPPFPTMAAGSQQRPQQRRSNSPPVTNPCNHNKQSCEPMGDSSQLPSEHRSSHRQGGSASSEYGKCQGPGHWDVRAVPDAACPNHWQRDMAPSWSLPDIRDSGLPTVPNIAAGGLQSLRRKSMQARAHKSQSPPQNHRSFSPGSKNEASHPNAGGALGSQWQPDNARHRRDRANSWEAEFMREAEHAREAEKARSVERVREAERAREAEHIQEVARAREAERTLEIERSRDEERAREAGKSREVGRSWEAKFAREAERSWEAGQPCELSRAQDAEHMRQATRGRSPQDVTSPHLSDPPRASSREDQWAPVLSPSHTPYTRCRGERSEYSRSRSPLDLQADIASGELPTVSNVASCEYPGSYTPAPRTSSPCPSRSAQARSMRSPSRNEWGNHAGMDPRHRDASPYVEARDIASGSTNIPYAGSSYPQSPMSRQDQLVGSHAPAFFCADSIHSDTFSSHGRAVPDLRNMNAMSGYYNSPDIGMMRARARGYEAHCGERSLSPCESPMHSPHPASQSTLGSSTTIPRSNPSQTSADFEGLGSCLNTAASLSTSANLGWTAMESELPSTSATIPVRKHVQDPARTPTWRMGEVPVPTWPQISVKPEQHQHQPNSHPHLGGHCQTQTRIAGMLSSTRSLSSVAEMDLQSLRSDLSKRLQAVQREEARRGFGSATHPETREFEQCVGQAPMMTAPGSCSASVDSEQALCVVCQEEPRQVVFQPCRHLVCCKSCSTSLRSCPMCRAEIKHRLEVYL